MIDYAVIKKPPAEAKAHNSCMDMPEKCHQNLRLDEEYNGGNSGSNLQNVNLNKYRYDDYQTSNCS
jgi:hypothetical protein